MQTRVLVLYASRHGSTRGIAERLASTLSACGVEATLADATHAPRAEGYDAYVIGSAAYMTHWIKDAAEFVRHNRSTLASKPVWLFSSGPVGTETVDKEGRDLRTVSEPREFAEFESAIHPRGHRVFYGAWDPNAKPIGVAERLGAAILSHLPAEADEALPAGDFRDWDDIDAWAREIANELTPVAAG